MKRYQIIPLVIGIYALVMAYIGRETFYDPATRLTYLLKIGGEALVLVALYFFLKRRDGLRKRK